MTSVYVLLDENFTASQVRDVLNYVERIEIRNNGGKPKEGTNEQ